MFDAQVPAPHGARIEHWDSGKDEVKGTAEQCRSERTNGNTCEQ